jgi:4-alpha-glucanotransferase
LAEQAYQPFRDMLSATMKYAGAVRIDHVLGLKRIYLIPIGFPPDQGVYLNMPFEDLLAVLADESRTHRCIVIGEDLGTVPEGFREKLADWGIWSYRVMVFEREWESGSFLPPDAYTESALATFSTHDLPPFASWITGTDRDLRENLGMDPGETAEERQRALKALDHVLGGKLRGGFIEIVKWLSQTPSRLLAISIEDALGLAEQINVPGTVQEHPNWRKRLPCSLDDDRFSNAIATIGKAASRAPY